jgi:hypothetical protein
MNTHTHTHIKYINIHICCTSFNNIIYMLQTYIIHKLLSLFNDVIIIMIMMMIIIMNIEKCAAVQLCECIRASIILMGPRLLLSHINSNHMKGTPVLYVVIGFLINLQLCSSPIYFHLQRHFCIMLFIFTSVHYAWLVINRPTQEINKWFSFLMKFSVSQVLFFCIQS